MSDIETTQQEYDDTKRTGKATLSSPKGRILNVRVFLNEWLTLIRNAGLLLGMFVAFVVASHNFAVKPIRQDIQQLRKELAIVADPSWTLRYTWLLERERGRLNTEYIPISRESLTDIHELVFPPPKKDDQ